MRSACLERTRFILNNFSGIGLGGPRTPLGYAPVKHIQMNPLVRKC